MANAQNRHIGQLAVEQGYLEADQLRDALVEFEKLQKSGSHISFDEFLVAEAYMVKEQLEELLHPPDKRA